MPGRELTLADGQLGVSSATILSGADAPSRSILAVFSNIASVSVTVLLTFSRAGGTARRLARAVLAQHDQLIVRNVPMQPDDTLSGYASVSGAIDYLVNSAQGGTLSIGTVSADGSPKASVTGSSVITGELDVDQIPRVEALLEELRDEVARHTRALELAHGIEVPE